MKTNLLFLFIIISNIVLGQAARISGEGIYDCATYTFDICGQLTSENSVEVPRLNCSPQFIFVRPMGFSTSPDPSLWRVRSDNWSYIMLSGSGGRIEGSDINNNTVFATFSVNETIRPVLPNPSWPIGFEQYVQFSINNGQPIPGFSIKASNYKIIPNPVDPIQIDGPGELCVGEKISLTSLVAGGSWSSSDPSIATISNGLVTGVSPGNIVIRYMINIPNSSCQNLGVKTIKVSSSALVELASAADTLNICKGELLIANSNFWSNPRWQTPDGVTPGQQNYLATKSGWYKISNGIESCISKDSVYVVLTPLLLNLNQDDTVKNCKPQALQVTGNYLVAPQWQTPNGTISGPTRIVADLTGKYLVQNQNKNCLIKDSVYVILKSASFISFQNQPDTLFTCKAVLLSPYASSFINTIWHTPSGIFNNLNTFQATTSGKYKVENGIENCINSDSIFIIFKDTSNIDLQFQAGPESITDFNIKVEEGQFPFVVEANTKTQAITYQWFLNGTPQMGNGFFQRFSLKDSGKYSIRLVLTTADSCKGKAEGTIRINRALNPILEIPNLVTMNSDTKNDLFEILNLSYFPENELIVFNRWGKEVFKAMPYKNNWPDSELNPGTYFFRLTAGQKYSGWVVISK